MSQEMGSPPQTLHLAAGAVELLVQILRRPWLGRQRGDHEARLLGFIQILGLGHHATRAGPALVGSVGELGEDTRRLGKAQRLAIAGLCYLTNSFANFLSPLFAAHLLPYILIPGVVEILLALWLFVMGVNVQRWKEQASTARERQ